MKTSYFTKLAGTSFRQDAIVRLSKTKNKGNTFVRAVPEPDNEYDQYAVRVEAMTQNGWEHIGYIKKGSNEEIQKRLLEGKAVDIGLSAITGEDKETLGVNISVEWEDDSGLDPIDMKDFESQKVFIGDTDYVMFDPINHKAYDESGHELLSGSNAEKMFLEPFDPKYPAKAIAKSTGAKADDIVSLWENNRDLSADYGTLIHAALEKYLKYSRVMRKIDVNKEREHSAKNWMPDHLGEIVDKFVKASGITDATSVECRIKKDNRTGIVDLLLMQDENSFTLMDYKVMPEVKMVKYKQYGKMQKYTIQQNFYREIIEDCGYKCNGMFLWNWDGKDWKKIKVPKINVKENL